MAPNEIVFILKGTTLPIFQNWWVCVHIKEEHAGSVEARFGPLLNDNGFTDFGSGQNPQECFKIAKGEVAVSTACRLAELAGNIHKRKINVPSTVFDGFPVTCAVLCGATGKTKFVSCNLAGVSAAPNEPPYVLLVVEVFAAGRALIDVPSGFGSTAFKTGEIQIGDL